MLIGFLSGSYLDNLALVNHYRKVVLDINNKLQIQVSSGVVTGKVNVTAMSDEILAVIQKWFPEEKTKLQELSCHGGLARCLYSIDEQVLSEKR